MDFLLPFRADDLGPSTLALVAISLLVFMVRMIIKGDLVSRAVHEEIRADRDKWQSNCERLSDQVDAIVEGLRTTEHLVASLPLKKPGDE